MCPVPFNSARALGPGWWKVPNTFAVKELLLITVGVEPKEGESPVELFFFYIMDATWPQGAADIRWNRITSSLKNFYKSENRKKGNLLKVKTELMKIGNGNFVPLHFVLMHISHYLVPNHWDGKIDNYQLIALQVSIINGGNDIHLLISILARCTSLIGRNGAFEPLILSPQKLIY